ncbi:hypothetical protein ABPG72_021689 [Tetrahymena utriculariae]
MKYFFLILILNMKILLFVFCSCPKMVPLLTETSYFSCEQSQIGQSEKGALLLLGQQPNTFQLTIVGWYRLIGKSNQNYLLIQARNSPTQNIIKIVYNPVLKQLYCTILNQILSPEDISQQLQNGLQDNWFFIKVGMNLNDLNTNQSYIYFTILTSSFPPITQSLLYNSMLSFFDNQNFEYFNGSQMYYPYSRSCSIAKQILLFIGKSNDSIQGSLVETNIQEMAMLPKLIYYFDFVKASSKSGYLYNLAPEQQKCYKSNCIDQLAWPYYKFTSNSQFQSDRPIDFQEENGLMFSFDVYIGTSDDNYYGGILGLHAQAMTNDTLPWITAYQIIINSGNIQDYYQDKDFNFFLSNLMPFSFYQQHQIVCVFTKKFDQVIRQLYLDGVLIFNSTFFNTFWGQLGIGLYNFAQYAPSTTRIVQIKSFKLYSGGFFNSCYNCNININNYDCFYCQNASDYLKFDSQYSCQLSCSSPFLIQQNLCLYDTSNSSQCQQPGQDLFNDQCRCPDGQYFDIILSKCQNCLYYCRTCQTQYTCETFLNSNNYNGQCDNNSFNDETQCISLYLKIVSNQNQKFVIDNSQINCLIPSNNYNFQQFQVRDQALKIGYESQSFFFTLNFNLQISSLQKQNIYTICYLMNKNNHIFSIISMYNSQNILQIMFINSDNQTLLQAYIEPDIYTYLGFYYDFFGIMLILKQKWQQVSYYKINMKSIIKQKLDDPYLVIGIQSPLFQNQYPLCGTIGSNNWIFQGDISMRSFSTYLLEFFQKDLDLILNFNFLEYQQEFQNKQLVIQNKQDSSITLSFSNQNYGFNILRGIQMPSQNQAILNFNYKLNQVPFCIMMSITPIYYNQCEHFYYNIVSLAYSNNLQFIFRLNSDQSLHYNYQLELCAQNIYNYNCKKFNKPIIKYDQPTNIFIKVEYYEYSSSLIMAKFNVVINYVQDSVEMLYPFSIIPNNYDIIIGDSYTRYALLVLTNQPILYYGQIHIYLGGFYYISYDNQDPCFIYINRANMTCIFPKQNYSLKDGQAISQNDCNKDNKNQELYYYDEITKTCQNSGLIFPNCININIQTKECSQCIDSNMILSQNCSCPSGMFYEENSKVYCSLSCSTCITNQNNCLTCRNQNQIPPLCNCSQADQYRDSNFVCRQCNMQCSTCIGDPDYCLSCSQNRLNPPLCNIFTPNNCPSKCKYCNQDSLCTQCSGNRISPPNCVCPDGYFSDPATGLCQICQQGQFYDQTQKTCLKCFELCGSCFGKESFNCSTCLFGLQLNKSNECICSNNLVLVQISNQNYCFQLMQIEFTIQFINNQYQLIIEFPYEIDQLQIIINQQGLNQLFQVHINQLQNNFYSIQDFQIQENNKKIILQLDILTNIKQTTGYLLFQKTNIFQNSQNMVVLNPIYNKQPLNFQIGPYFQETTIKIPIDNIIPSNQNLISIINKFQFLFYILNSIQPTAMFLMLGLQFPPNLYQYLTCFGKFVFRNTEETQSSVYKSNFSFLGFDLNQDVKEIPINQLNRLGFSNSILVNCQIIVGKNWLFLKQFKDQVLKTKQIYLCLQLQYAFNTYKQNKAATLIGGVFIQVCSQHFYLYYLIYGSLNLLTLISLQVGKFNQNFSTKNQKKLKIQRILITIYQKIIALQIQLRRY